MSTAVAQPLPAPFPNLDRDPSPRNYSSLPPANLAPSVERNGAMASNEGQAGSSPSERTPPDGKRSPRGTRVKPIVKKEPPSSPTVGSTAKHRPRKLDLQTSTTAGPPAITPRPSMTPLTGSNGLVMHDVGLACISPGFQTHDPSMREQLQRSMSVRDQQRSIIESRLLKSAKGDGPDNNAALESAMASARGKKRQPPPGLSIVPPSAQQFAHERVIQSAPLHGNFTGRNQPHPGSRPTINQPSNLAPSTSIHHTPAIQTNNRLPPISDVFGADTLNPSASCPSFYHQNSTSSNGPPMPSPGFPPQTAHPMSQGSHNLGIDRPREFRSAEEAVHELTGGREDLLPKIVHYGGHQPPTPPSPHQHSRHLHTNNTTTNHEGLTPNKYHHLQPNGIDSNSSTGLTSRRRSRHEYEADNSSPPLGNNGRERMVRPTGPFGEGRDSPATQQAKKEEFLTLCSRAWDLFHF